MNLGTSGHPDYILLLGIHCMWNHHACLSPHVYQPEDKLHPDWQLGRRADVDILYAALLNLLIFLSPLPVLGWLLQLERWQRIRRTWLLWRRQEVIYFTSCEVWTLFAVNSSFDC